MDTDYFSLSLKPIEIWTPCLLNFYYQLSTILVIWHNYHYLLIKLIVNYVSRLDSALNSRFIYPAACLVFPFWWPVVSQNYHVQIKLDLSVLLLPQVSLYSFFPVHINSISKSCYIFHRSMSRISCILTTATPYRRHHDICPQPKLWPPNRIPSFPMSGNHWVMMRLLVSQVFRTPSYLKGDCLCIQQICRCWGSPSLVLTTLSGKIPAENRVPTCSSNEIGQMESFLVPFVEEWILSSQSE